MFKNLLILATIVCFIGCGADTTDILTPTEAVPAAPSKNGEKLVDVTKFAFAFLKSHDEGWRYFIRVYNPFSDNFDPKIVVTQPGTTLKQMKKIKVYFAPQAWEGEAFFYKIKSAKWRKVAPTVIDDESHPTFKVYATKKDYKKAKKLYGRLIDDDGINWEEHLMKMAIDPDTPIE